MKKLLIILALCASAFAREKTQGYCEQGGQVLAVTSSLNSTGKTQLSYPSCTVTVYLAGTLSLATIYADDGGTSKANPFTASNTGLWFYYADDGRYDVRFSGGGISSPYTIGDVQSLDWLLLGHTPPFSDATAILKNSSDTSKLLKFGLSGIATGMTRTLSIQDFNYTVAGLDIPQTFSGSGSNDTPLRTKNSIASGYSGITFLDAGGSSAGLIGYANPSTILFNSDVIFGSTVNVPVVLFQNQSPRITLDSAINISGHLLPSSPGIYNIGAIGKEWNHAYIDDANVGTLNVTGSCIGCGAPPFSDAGMLIANDTDSTKQFRIRAQDITTGTQRTLDVQDADYILAGTNLRQTFAAFASGQSILRIANTSSAGFSAVEFLNSSQNSRGLVGYANTGASVAPDSFIIGTNGPNKLMFYTNGVLQSEIDTAGGFSPTAANSEIATLGHAGQRWGTVTATGVSLNHTSFILNGATWNFQAGSTLNVNTDYNVGSNNAYDIASSVNRIAKIWTTDLDVSGTCTGCGGGGGGGNPFSDATPLVRNSADNTKTILLSAAALTTGTNQVLNVQDNTGYTLAGTDIQQKFSVGAAGNSILRLENSNNTGYSAVEFLDSSGASKGLIGYSNSSAGVSPGTILIGSNGLSKLSFYVNGTLPIELNTDGVLRPTVNLSGTGLGDVSHKWPSLFVSVLEIYGGSDINNGGTLTVQNGGTFQANAGASFTVDTGSFTSSLSTNGAFFANGGINNSGLYQQTSSNTGQTSISLIDANGTTTANAMQFSTFGGTIYFKVIGGTDSGAPGTVVSRDHVPFTDNAYQSGNSTHHWIDTYTNSIDMSGGGGTITTTSGGLGQSGTKSVRNATNSGSCNLVFEQGLLISSTC